MGVVISSRVENLPGVSAASWLDDRALRLAAEDRRSRRAPWIHSVVLHTTKGIPGGHDMTPQTVLPGYGPRSDLADKVVSFWSHDGRGAGAHLIVDFDGSVYCTADLLTEVTYHAGVINEWSVGIEIAQRSDAALYAGQLERVVDLVDALTLRFGIQRQVPKAYRGHALARLDADPAGWIGVCGHRDVSDNRGSGDPGDAIFSLLVAAGYEAWDVAGYEDVEEWKQRQVSLGLAADGLPGPQTRQAIMRASIGRGNGLWVVRPCDSLASSPTS